MVDILSERAATQTGSELFGFLGVVALNPEYAVILDVQSNRTSAAAVKGGGGADDFYTFISFVNVCGTHILLLIIWIDIFKIRVSGF
jgi:hypothetical protein